MKAPVTMVARGVWVVCDRCSSPWAGPVVGAPAIAESMNADPFVSVPNKLRRSPCCLPPIIMAGGRLPADRIPRTAAPFAVVQAARVVTEAAVGSVMLVRALWIVSPWLLLVGLVAAVEVGRFLP